MANKRKRTAARYNKTHKAPTPATTKTIISHWINARDFNARPNKTSFITAEDISTVNVWEAGDQLEYRKRLIKDLKIPITTFERKMKELYETVGIKSEYEIYKLSDLDRELFISQSKKLLDMRDATQIGAWNTYESDIQRYETFKSRNLIPDNMSFTDFRDMLFFMSQDGYKKATLFYASSQLIENITEMGEQNKYDWGKIKEMWTDFETGQASAGNVVLRRALAERKRREREERGEY